MRARLDDASTGPDGAALPDPEQDWSTWRDTLRHGDTLWDILARHDVPEADVNLILTGMDDEAPFSWRRLRPGQVLEVLGNVAGERRGQVVTQRQPLLVVVLEGEDAFVQRQPRATDLPLLRVRQRRQCLHLPDGT